MIIGIIPARCFFDFLGNHWLISMAKHATKGIRTVSKIKFRSALVATDDERIASHVKEFNGEVILTASNHKSGTDRIAEALDILNIQDDGLVVNIQGDEPFINPEDINLLTACFEKQKTQIATLVKKIDAIETLDTYMLKKYMMI